MAKKKSPPSPIGTSSAAPAPRRRRTGAADQSPLTGGSATTSEEVQLAVANDTVDSGGTPSYDEIAAAAYQRYLNRGGGHGQDFDDWLAAERELQQGKRG
jgi:hypothetical protein